MFIATKPLSILAAVLLAVTACGFDPCGNTVTRRLPSPSATRTAVVFERSCGAATSRAGRGVSILMGRDTTLSPPDKGNVYLNDNQRHRTSSRAPTDVEISWDSDTVLVVRQPVDAHVVFAAIRFAGITIKYDTLR